MKSTSGDDCGLSPLFCTDSVPIRISSALLFEGPSSLQLLLSCCYFRGDCFLLLLLSLGVRLTKKYFGSPSLAFSSCFFRSARKRFVDGIL